MRKRVLMIACVAAVVVAAGVGRRGGCSRHGQAPSPSGPADRVARVPARSARSAPRPAWTRAFRPPSADDAHGGNDPAMAEPADGGRDAIPGEYVFAFYDEQAREEFARLARRYGATVLGTSRVGNALRLRVGSEALLQRLLREGPVPTDYAHNYYTRSPLPPDLEARTAGGPYVAFGNQSLQWLGVTGDNGEWGRGVTVAILDSGVSAHPALADSHIAEISFVDGAASGDAGHGTAVASIIGGSSPDVQGIAPGADILSVKVIGEGGTGDTFTLAQGIVEAVDQGARVLNLSLGTHGDSFILASAVQYAIDNGAVVVAATGNEGVNLVTYPAAYEGVLAVTAVDGAGQHVYFANRGDQVDIAAPGVGLAAAGADGDTTLFSGTSAATPLVAGAVAALLSQDASMTGQEAAALVTAYGNDAGAPGVDPEYGAGILDVGRLENRATAGLYDVALGSAYLPPTEDVPVLTLYVQNRGTEPLTAVDMAVEINGTPSVVNFFDIGVGETASRSFELLPEQLAEGIPIIYSATIDGAEDVAPANNAPRRLVIGVQATE